MKDVEKQKRYQNLEEKATQLPMWQQYKLLSALLESTHREHLSSYSQGFAAGVLADKKAADALKKETR